MFDFGFAELFVIIAAGIFLIGPKEIPGALRALGQGIRRLQYVRYSMTSQFEKFMQDNDLNDVRHYSVDPMGEPVREQKDGDMLPLEKEDKH